MARGFYSIVQYCPDRFRAEAVNIGLLLLCTEPHDVRVRMTSSYARVRKLFSLAKSDFTNLKLATHGLTSRIQASAGDLRTAEDLASFASTRANDLRLTEPRLAKLDDIESDIERLYAELVDRQSMEHLAQASPAEVLPPRLNEVFYRLQRDNKIWQPGIVTVPIYKRKIEIPYAYKNGFVNLVKPHVFPATKRAESQAAMLAINGDLIRKHPVNGEQHQLIVVSTQETAEQAREVTEHVEPLFREYRVRLVRPDSVDAFAQEVERSAH